VIVCGGTLGIFVATALASKGLNVGIVERNVLKGVLRIFWFQLLYCFEFHKKNVFRLRLILLLEGTRMEYLKEGIV
jgi:2-polyprenyl-6-methoxyphenol hydroxylase-like FAD-dependent oxidoreductase